MSSEHAGTCADCGEWYEGWDCGKCEERKRKEEEEERKAQEAAKKKEEEEAKK